MKSKAAVMIRNLQTRLAASLRRFPEALLLALGVVIVLIYLNHSSVRALSLERAAMALALGFPIALCINIARERFTLPRRATSALYLLAALAVFLYYSVLLPNLEMVAVTRFIGINIALYLVFICIPYLRRREGFELYVIKLFTSFITSYFYSLILYAGLSAILFTINTLFAAGISEKVYFDLWLIVAVVFAPAYFLAGVPAYQSEPSLNEYPKFLQILLLYIVMPLLTVYTGILYAYFFKILATRNWPEGMVSNLVLWYAFIVTIVVFFIYQLKDDNHWAQLFERYLPRVILPLLLMMFVAMGIRINAYGVTENRYLVLAGGAWASGCMLYCAFKARRTNLNLVLSAAVLAILVVSGPWSCYKLSEFSQNARFEMLLNRNNMLVNGSIVPGPAITAADKQAISSIIQYFESDKRLQELKHLPRDFTLNKMKETFGFDMTIAMDSPYFSHSVRDSNVLQDIRGYDYFLPMMPSPATLAQGEITAAYDPSTGMLQVLRQANVIYEKNISQAALAIHEAHPYELELSQQDMVFRDENEKVKVMVLFRNIHGPKEGGDSRLQKEFQEFSLFIKLK